MKLASRFLLALVSLAVEFPPLHLLFFFPRIIKVLQVPEPLRGYLIDGSSALLRCRVDGPELCHAPGRARVTKSVVDIAFFGCRGMIGFFGFADLVDVSIELTVVKKAFRRWWFGRSFDCFVGAVDVVNIQGRWGRHPRVAGERFGSIDRVFARWLLLIWNWQILLCIRRLLMSLIAMTVS